MKSPQKDGKLRGRESGREESGITRHQSQTGFRDHPISKVQIIHLDLGEECGPAE